MTITLDQQYRNVLILLVVVIFAGSGYWILKHFHPALLLGELEFVALPSDLDDPAQNKPVKSTPTLQQPALPPEIAVHVAGAVQSPGVYHLASGARVLAAIDKAGGPTDHADVHRLNLAAKIRDGQQIYVPEIPQATPPIRSEGSPGASAADQVGSLHTASTVLHSPAVPQSVVATPTSMGGPLINLNISTPKQLETLPRIGPVTARRIVEHRETYGGFLTIDDLTSVKGIGEKTLEKIRHLIVVY